MGGTICVHTILHLGIKNVTFFMASGILQKMTDRYFTMFQNWGYVCVVLEMIKTKSRSVKANEAKEVLFLKYDLGRMFSQITLNCIFF